MAKVGEQDLFFQDYEKIKNKGKSKNQLEPVICQNMAVLGFITLNASHEFRVREVYLLHSFHVLLIVSLNLIIGVAVDKWQG